MSVIIRASFCGFVLEATIVTSGYVVYLIGAGILHNSVTGRQDLEISILADNK